MKKETTNLEKEKIIEKKSMQILRFLNLRRKSSNIIDQLGIVLRLYKYVVQNIYSDAENNLENISGTKQEEYLNNLYLGVTRNPGNQTTNAILFKYLLYLKGFESSIVLSRSKNNNSLHVSNLVKIGKEQFFFDPTLERSIYEEQGKNPDDILFCCAALGEDEYKKFYTPIEVLPEDLNKPTLPLPSNIAEESMPETLIESIGKIIPNLLTEKNEDFEKCAEEESQSIFDLVRKSTKKGVKTNKEER